jgi:hypothetical protein
MAIKIGVLHSTAVTSLMQDNFTDGLQAAGHWPDGSFEFMPPENLEGNYGRNDAGTTLRRIV